MLNTYFYMCFEFFVDERCLKQGEGKGRPGDLWLSHDFGIGKACAPADHDIVSPELVEGDFGGL